VGKQKKNWGVEEDRERVRENGVNFPYLKGRAQEGRGRGELT